jgi:hypothetical protein
MRPHGTLSPEFIKAWNDYEEASAKAAEQYERMPIGYWASGPSEPCIECGLPTRAKSGVCLSCVKAEREA